ncbi:TonB-dependent receptor [Sphingobium sp. TKS]|uniref:TonB-dependent receptor n=1 Tax=Sphingobium sp. TKS TaxID=1315974 RepID=UPI0007700645|nr:TonB-dependent receptor plug domain-containing protein [Sphingobium sp. TKS]AMK25519.1 TonB-dependent receptor [Sphingobium sp. TKS]
MRQDELRAYDTGQAVSPLYRRILMASAGSAAIALFGLAGNVAIAQSASSAPQAAESAPQPADTSDIVVTAQRREESLSKVPLSVAALSSETLQNRVVTKEQDLAALVPGLIVKNGQNQNQLSFTMRGQTLDPFSGASPAVLTYLNEVPFTGGNSATAFYDFSSVQVLKGPQGTLFGRNATGGAVLYASAKPGEDFGGFGTIRAGERDLIQLQGAVDIPVIPGKILLRVAGDYQKQDGYVHNLLTGNTLGDVDNRSGRITAVLRPTDTIENTTVFQYSRFRGTESNGQLYSYYPLGSTNTSSQTGITYNLTATLDALYGNGFFPGVGDGPPGPGTFPGAVAGYLAWQKAHPYETYLSYDLPHKASSYFLSNTTTFELNDNLTVKNIFGFEKTFARTAGILSGSPFASLDLYNSSGNYTGPPGGQVFRNKSISEELQLQGKSADGKLEYIIGGFYNYATKEEAIPVIVGAELPTPAGEVLYHTHGTTRSRAVYGQATYDLSDAVLEGLKFTAGARYTWETVGMTSYDDHAFFVGFPREKATLKAPSWVGTLQWQASPASQFYFTQRGSFRAGNFNGAVVPYGLANFFKNEYTHDFELGYKFSGMLLGQRAHFNVAAYKQIVKNAQHSLYAVVAGAPSAFTVNVPEAQVKGVEMDGDIMSADWLKLGFSGAYTDAKYTKNIVDLSVQTGTPGFVVPFDSYPDAPKWSGSLYADLTLPTPAQWGEMHFRVDSFSQTSSYFSNNNYSITPGTKIKGYTTIAARLSWNEIMGSPLSLGIYAKNLFDRQYYQSGYVLGASGGMNTVIPGEPQTFGAEVTMKF